jgi:hypothetical protein
MSKSWTNERLGNGRVSWRCVRRFAFLPKHTDDAGWIWWRKYWRYERRWNFGLIDTANYVDPTPYHWMPKRD